MIERRMLRVFFKVIALVFGLAWMCEASAQSSLPPCASTRGVWNRCIGTRISPTGKYVGEFRDGGFNGHGTVTLPDGTKFVGEWKDGMPNGQGTVTLPDGTKYVGEFPISTRKENLPGRPSEAFDGHKYVGGYRDGHWNRD